MLLKKERLLTVSTKLLKNLAESDTFLYGNFTLAGKHFFSTNQYNVQNHKLVTLEFDYSYHQELFVVPNDFASIELSYDDVNWQNIHTLEQTCSFAKNAQGQIETNPYGYDPYASSCIQHVEIDLTNYANQPFKLRVVHSTSPAIQSVSANLPISRTFGIDNFQVVAQRFDCNGSLNLTGVETSDINYNANLINSNQTIDDNKATYIANEVILNSGFEVKAGAQFEANPKLCKRISN